MIDGTTEDLVQGFSLVFIISLILLVTKWIISIIVNNRSKSKLPNHILYFKSKSAQLEYKAKSEMDSKLQSSNKTSQTGQFQQSRIKQFLPPEITPFGDQAISQPNQRPTKKHISLSEPRETNISGSPTISPKTPKTSTLLEKIQQQAKKIHDETKKADKERKEKERKEAEERKKQRDEEIRKKLEAEAAAATAAPAKKGILGTGGLSKNLSKTKLSLKPKQGTENAAAPATEAAPAPATEATAAPATEAAPAPA